MIANASQSVRVIVYEGNGSQVLADARRFALIQFLLENGYAVSNVRSGKQLPMLGHRRLVVLGHFLDEKPAEASDDEVQLRFVDIREQDNEQILAQVQESSDELGGITPGGWKPWFPVIDFDRCTNCMQCLSFCLFDVYGVTANGEITVQNETNCKTDCPACSRVCPEVAILFPKYKAGPINGDEINDEDLRREAMKVDISALLGGDIYSMLRDRNAKAKSRFSKERDDERALKERQRCMKALQKEMQDLDIPADVVANLPSADEIQFKAEQAKQRAQAALDQQGK